MLGVGEVVGEERVTTVGVGGGGCVGGGGGGGGGGGYTGLFRNACWQNPLATHTLNLSLTHTHMHTHTYKGIELSSHISYVRNIHSHLSTSVASPSPQSRATGWGTGEEERESRHRERERERERNGGKQGDTERGEKHSEAKILKENRHFLWSHNERRDSVWSVSSAWGGGGGGGGQRTVCEIPLIKTAQRE